jgi:hypothetical protein
MGADKHVDMAEANGLAADLAIRMNEHDLATAVVAVGLALGMAVVELGADETFRIARQHAEKCAETTRRYCNMRDHECLGSA